MTLFMGIFMFLNFPMYLALLFLTLTLDPFNRPEASAFIDPTGTYILKGDVKKNHILNHSRKIRVKLIDPHRVAMSFYINKGYPGYESGSFIDTLVYDENMARYSPASDPDCSILFAFGPTSAEIQQVYSNPNCNCGFGKGILISTFFQKASEEEPVIEDLSVHGSW